MIRLIPAFVILLLAPALLNAQTTYQKEGIKDGRPGLYAFTNATIIPDSKTTLNDATLVVRDGKVEAVGKGVSIPKGAIVYDCKGKFIYPAFIDLHTGYGIAEAKQVSGPRSMNPQIETSKTGPYYWNEAIKPETNAIDLFKHDKKEAEEWRKAGFGTVMTFQGDGIVRGSASLVNLAADIPHVHSVLLPVAAAEYSFSKGVSRQSYPSSLMGSIALLRQFYMDTDWYKKGGHAEERNLSLEAQTKLGVLPQVFETSSVFDILRADKVGDEFGYQYIFQGSGDEYQRVGELKKTKASLILPVKFPEAYDVADPNDARMVSLAQMKHWELAPYNPKILSDSGIRFSFTATGLKKKDEFLKNIRLAVKKGLSQQAAIMALCEVPAEQVKASSLVGSLSKGKFANFLIASDTIFKDDATLLESWVMGDRQIIQKSPDVDLRGVYDLKIAGYKDFTFSISGTLYKNEYELLQEGDSTKIKPDFTLNNGLVSIGFNNKKDSVLKGQIRLSGYTRDKGMSGTGTLADGKPVTWEVVWKEESKPKNKQDTAKKKEVENPVLSTVQYPFVGFGWTNRPVQEKVLFKSATVWTNEKEGILQEADVLIDKGKIVRVGKGLSEPGAKVVEAKGKHLTSGIIDEHSHIAISRGVNEGGQAITAEVSIGDVVNGEDINIYRQLAGGVTGAQLLHGSANPVGGQSALVKLRWGATGDEMKIKGADGFIKFALGENPKNGNSGSYSTNTYPQTRMGVEQVYYDGFYRALEYRNKWNSYNKLAPKDRVATVPPRKDIELEILLEILDGKRFISCHSYVQSEINMLMKVADSLGFKVNTFTHILEGYKLADKMKSHGVAASTFADWWAYKWEVNDAIPYNAAILQKMDVITAINSDDAEMGRRLNQEAAKAVKYGNLGQEEAWKMVTSNPAKMLHLDKITGSIAPGKDADLVLWNNNPLSIYAKPEQTWVDGIRYFDLASDQRMRDEISAERNRLIQAMLKAKEGGGGTQKPEGKKDKMYHCEDLEEEGYGHED